MNKERITFAVVVLLLLLLGAFSGDVEKRSRRRGRVRPRPAREYTAAEIRKGEFLAEGVETWSPILRNPFRAPRQTQDLPPLDLAAPPFPRLPHPGLPLVPTVGGAARNALRHALVPDSSIELGTGQETVTVSDGGEDPAPGETDSQGGVSGDLDLVDRSAVGLTEAEKLRMSYSERLERERRQAEAAMAELERRKLLDRVVWLNESIDYGEIVPESRKQDRYELKLEIDRLRADTSMSNTDRERALEKIRLIFKEDRGPSRATGRATLSGTQVQRVEFAPTPLNRFHLRRLSTPRDDVEKQIELARGVFDAGHYDVAAEHLAGLLERDMDAVQIYAILADAYRRQYRYEDEFRTLQRGLKVHPESASLLARAGQLLTRLKTYGKAREFFERALKSNPGDALSNLGLGMIELDGGDPHEAVGYLRSAQTGVGLDADQKILGYLRLGQAYAALGDLRNAGLQFDVVLDRDPTHPEALAGAAVVAFAQGDVPGAKALIQKGVAAHPLDGTLAYLNGVAQLRSGEYDAARATLLLARELDPLLTGLVRTSLSYLMETAGQDEAALNEVDLAIVADPINPETRLQQARALLNVGDLDGAREIYLAVLAEDPGRSDVLVALGDVHFLRSEFDAARRFYERAAAGEPNFPGLRGRILVTEVRRRRMTAAEETLKKIGSDEAREPFMLAAVAFYHYFRGNAEETLHALRRLRDTETAPERIRSYAANSVQGIEDNLSKELWTDTFDRSGSDLLRGWDKVVGSGITVSLSAQSALLSGRQKQVSDRPTVLYQKRPGRTFHSFSVDLELPEEPQPGVWAGAGFLVFSRNRGAVERWPGFQERDGQEMPYAGCQVARGPDARLYYRYLSKYEMSDWELVPLTEYQGGSLTLGFVLQDSRSGTFDVLVDQKVVIDDLVLPGMGRLTKEVELQVFCQAAIDREVSFRADNVNIVTTKR